MQCKHSFLSTTFRWDPSKRMTPDEAIHHEWIQEGRFQKTRGQSRHITKRTLQTNGGYSFNSKANVGNNIINENEVPINKNTRIGKNKF